MKLIFLDLDGVLATNKQFNLTHNSKTWIHKYDVYPFDKLCVSILNDIIEETNAEIILTSDWRVEYNKSEIQDIFELNEVIKYPIDFTIKLPCNALKLAETRAEEIKRYIVKYDIQKYIVIDDLDMQKWFDEDNFQLCGSSNEGIKQCGLKEKIINKLNK